MAGTRLILSEGWLVEEGDRLYPQKGAFQPFEFGPRNRRVQDIAILEPKLVLIRTAQEFEVKSMYDEWDKKCQWRQSLSDSVMGCASQR